MRRDQCVKVGEMIAHAQTIRRHPLRQVRTALVVKQDTVRLIQPLQCQQRAMIAAGPAMQNDEKRRTFRDGDAAMQHDTLTFET